VLDIFLGLVNKGKDMVCHKVWCVFCLLSYRYSACKCTLLAAV